MSLSKVTEPRILAGSRRNILVRAKNVSLALWPLRRVRSVSRVFLSCRTRTGHRRLHKTRSPPHAQPPDASQLHQGGRRWRPCTEAPDQRLSAVANDRRAEESAEVEPPLRSDGEANRRSLLSSIHEAPPLIPAEGDLSSALASTLPPSDPGRKRGASRRDPKRKNAGGNADKCDPQDPHDSPPVQGGCAAVPEKSSRQLVSGPDDFTNAKADLMQARQKAAFDR